MIHLIRYTLLLMLLLPLTARAQVGDYRNVFSIGAGGGYVMNTMTFQPTVTQNMHTGITLGLTGRYTCEKYFSTICAIQAEVNIAQLGWTQDNATINNTQAINPATGLAEEYQRDITYIQVPIFAHLGWGREQRGFNGFVNLGPQLGYMISDKTKKNYDKAYTEANYPDGFTNTQGRVSQVEAQENMPVENKLDFGIALGAGIECHINKIGRFDLEGRFYYGLGNIYGDSKRDYFGTSSHTTITVKLSYLYDL